MGLFILQNEVGEIATRLLWKDQYTKLCAYCDEDCPPIIVVADMPDIKGWHKVKVNVIEVE